MVARELEGGTSTLVRSGESVLGRDVTAAGRAAEEASALGRAAEGRGRIPLQMVEDGSTTSCFAPEMKMRTPDGSKSIIEFKRGDPILSAPEWDVTAPPSVSYVEEVFENRLPLLSLHVGGQVIRTTAEHPFYIRGKGWVASRELEPGDLFRSHDGQWVPVQEVVDKGEESVVYNLRVSEYHTYFVGDESWGFSVWAHNQCGPNQWNHLMESEPGGRLSNEIARLPNGEARFRGMTVQVQEDISHMSKAQLEFMAERGVAGRTLEGETINLHHVNQNPKGPYWEIPATLNDVNNLELHPYGNTPGAGLSLQERAAHNDLREAYWKARANAELEQRSFMQNGVFE